MTHNLESKFLEVCETTRNYCQTATGSPVASIWFYEPSESGKGILHLKKELSADGQEIIVGLDERAIVAHTYRTGEFVVSSNVREEPRDEKGPIYRVKTENDTQVQISTLMSVPIITSDKEGKEIKIGVFQAANNPTGYNEIDIAILQTLAATVADNFIRKKSGLEIKEPLHEQGSIIRLVEDLRRASAIQQGMMAKMPKIKNLEFAVDYLPCAGLGGDWYYGKEVNENLHLIIGDGEGHGIEAAMIANTSLATIRTIFAMSKFTNKIEMQNVLKNLNQSLTDLSPAVSSKETLNTTLAYTIFTKDGTCYSLNAAHSNPLIISPEGNIEEKEVTVTMPLGPFDEEMFAQSLNEPTQFQLKKGDTWFAYTDGLTDLNNADNEMYGKERLIDFLSKTYKINPEILPKDLAQILKKELRKFSGARYQRNDDITFAVLRRTE